VFLGFNDFPYGLAEVQKIILISKSLIIAGNTVTVICRNGYHNIKFQPQMKACGIYESINYVYASGSCFRNEHFFKRRLLQIKGKINEILLLRNRKKKNNLDFAILSTRSFSSIVLYYLLAKILKFKIILNYVEYYSAIKKGKLQIAKRLNDQFFDKYAPSLSDGVFPISEFLINQIKKKSIRKKYLKIPVLTDFDKYNEIENNRKQNYFLFCGYAGYKEIIQFIIDSYELIEDHSVSLFLVINGRASDIEELKDYIKKQKKKFKIKVFSRLSEKELFTFYNNATALLIPLRHTLQDIARFPHKIGEYLASGNPVISTDYGEINYYFTNMVNMLLANSYDINLFAKKMQFVIDHPTESKDIGLKGKEIAYQQFDYSSIAGALDNYLNEL